jgi:hypothetical protein
MPALLAICSPLTYVTDINSSPQVPPPVLERALVLLLLLLLLLLRQVAVELHFSEIGKLGYAKNWLALVILLGMLVAIATEKVRSSRCCLTAEFSNFDCLPAALS